MASRSIADLSPRVRALALAFVQACDGAGLQVLIYCTLRSNEEQATLYARGRTLPGVVVTNARPGESLHNPDENGQAWAFDAVPVSGGVALWDNASAIKRMGEIGESVGLQWAGRWRGALRESVHFQIERTP